MEFFNSLTLDLKVLVIAIAGCALLALFNGNKNAEKRYVVVIVLLAAAGLWRFTHLPGADRAEKSVAEDNPAPHVTAPPKHIPLASTSAK
jgi:hypothetical protein